MIKTQWSEASIGPTGQTRLATVGNGKAFVLSAPRPDYPYEARSRHITGSGIAVISVDPNSGLAVDAMMEQSIGNPIWIIPPFPLSAAGVSNRGHRRGFAFQSLSC